MAYVPLLEVFMKQYEEGKNEEAAGNAFFIAVWADISVFIYQF